MSLVDDDLTDAALDTDLVVEAKARLAHCPELRDFRRDVFHFLPPLDPGGLTEILFIGRLYGQGETEQPLSAFLIDKPPGFDRHIAIERGW